MAAAIQRNYLKGVANPFGLADPPEWWMKRLQAFDDQLVIFPSQKHPWFKLARRAKLTAGTKPADVPGVENHPDTLIMCNNRLVPVTNVFPGAIWDNRVFDKLAERDVQRVGGAKNAIRIIEEAEAKREAALQKAQEEALLTRSQEAYASIKYRTGQRVSMAHHGSANNKQVKPLIFT